MTEVFPEGKNFRLLCEDELPGVLLLLGKFLPESIKFHETLKTYINDRVWNFHFYVCKSWPDDLLVLHFPGMTKTPHGTLYESFSVFCPTNQLDRLQLLFDEDLLIDWMKPIYLNFTHIEIVKRLEDYYTSVHGGTLDKLYGDVYSKNNGRDKFFVNGDAACCEVVTSNGTPHNTGEALNKWQPHDETDNIAVNIADEPCESDVMADGTKVLQLGAEHAVSIYELYPARELECIDVFTRLLCTLPSYGVFTEDGSLVAWMVQSYYGAMFSMQTRPEFRRKGYGSKLARQLTTAVSERGYLPFVVIRPENDASLALYRKLGFRKNYETIRAVLYPQKSKSPLSAATRISTEPVETSRAEESYNSASSSESSNLKLKQ